MLNLIISLFVYPCFAAQPAPLVISIKGQETTYTHEQLLSNPKTQTVKLPNDPQNNNKDTFYKAIALVDLLGSPETVQGKAVHFIASDGMAVIFKKDRLLAANGAKAFLAIKPFEIKWPVKRQKPVGPYYLFWLNPERSKIGPEEWPYLVNRIEIHTGQVETDYPKVPPASKIADNHPIRQGYQVFLKNCFGCHTMNQQGPAQLGPDLNMPFSPVDYWDRKFLKKYIRNPKAVRHWPQSKMPAFDESEINEKQLWALLRYLSHKAASRE